MTYATNAQNAATRAQASADQAGADAQAAADAASQAQETAAAKRDAELAAAAQAAADEMAQCEGVGIDPSQNSDQDKPWYADLGIWPEDIDDPAEWATVTSHWSTILGTSSLLGLVFPPVGLTLGLLGLGAGLASTILNGVAHGTDSAEFHSSLGQLLLGGMFFGKGRMFKAAGVDELVGAKVSEIAGELTQTVIGVFTW
ncbi:hypothetical protein [Streptomyces rubiginosohelvolus]|uniref:hypothetical protein n=1 Tax=Streptomyces rubiginosohelvolus TaxID=67362 RepID=UPI0036A4B609